MGDFASKVFPQYARGLTVAWCPEERVALSVGAGGENGDLFQPAVTRAMHGGSGTTLPPTHGARPLTPAGVVNDRTKTYRRCR